MYDMISMNLNLASIFSKYVKYATIFKNVVELYDYFACKYS